MATFSWVCYDCLYSWDRECEVGKAPVRTKCPDCRKLCERDLSNFNLGFAFGEDTDFHTVRSREKKFREHGYDKTAAERFYRTRIAATKERIADERGRYIPMGLDYERMRKQGRVRKLNDREVAEKVERAKKLTNQAYDEANKKGYSLDRTKPTKQQQ